MTQKRLSYFTTAFILLFIPQLSFSNEIKNADGFVGYTLSSFSVRDPAPAQIHWRTLKMSGSLPEGKQILPAENRRPIRPFKKGKRGVVYKKIAFTLPLPT